MAKKTIFKKEKGQALLFVLIVSTLTMLILLSIASRIDTGRASVRRSNEFDRAAALSENAVADLSRALNSGGAGDCLASIVQKKVSTEYFNLAKDTACNNGGNSLYGYLLSLLDPSLKADLNVFARLSPNSDIKVTPSLPYAMFFNNQAGGTTATKDVIPTCSDTSGVRANDKFVISRVYFESNDYKIDKAIFTCSPSSSGKAVTFYDENGTDVSNKVRSDTRMVRVRMLNDSASASNSISLEVKDSSKTVAISQKFEFIIVGAGGLGSDAIVKFDQPLDPQSPSAFDFVYFGEDTNP